MSISQQVDKGLKNKIGGEERGGYRVLFLAVMISLTIHLFWLTAIRVVGPKSSGEAVKFSRVSFLGPILSRGMMEVRVAAREESYLEKRYNDKRRVAVMPGASLTTLATARSLNSDVDIPPSQGPLTPVEVAGTMSERRVEASGTSDI